MKITIKIFVFTIKCLLLGVFGLWLGLGSYDPESSLLYQNWKVYIFLYLPLAMGTEGLLVAAIEAYEESKDDSKDKLKRYLVFEVAEWYPSGALSDVKESFHTPEEAIQYCKENPYNQSQWVWDRIEDEEIWSNKSPDTPPWC